MVERSPLGLHTGVCYILYYCVALRCVVSIKKQSFNENNYLKKCIPFTPKEIGIEIENRVFREVNRDLIFDFVDSSNAFLGECSRFLEESVLCGFLKESVAFPQKCINRISKSAATRFWCDCSVTSKSSELKMFSSKSMKVFASKCT